MIPQPLPAPPLAPPPSSIEARAHRALLVVFGVVLGETVFQTLIPVLLTEVRGASGLAVGWCIAASHGAGLVVSAPAARLCDLRGPVPVIRVAAVVALLSLVSLAVLVPHVEGGAWIVPVVAYGMARGVLIGAALTAVAQLSDPLVTQGRNAATQRGAAIVGVLIAGWVIATGHWQAGLWVLTGVSALALAAGLRLHAPPGRWPGVRDVLSGYRSVAGLLRRRPEIRASSILNLNTTFLFVLGNSFLPVVLVGEVDHAAGWITAVIVGRDLVAVAAGLRFARVVGRIGLRGALAAVVGGTAVSLGLLAALPVTPWALGVSAAAGGVAIGLAIGSTNLLAIGAGGLGVSQRLSATFQLNFAASLVLPVVVGAALDAVGARAMFGLAAAIAAGLGLVMLDQARRAVPAVRPRTAFPRPRRRRPSHV